MNKILAPISILVLLAALAGGVALTQRSANLKKSADEYFVSASVAPSTKKLALGETLPILVRLNTNNSTKTLTGASVEIGYDKTAFDYVSVKSIVTVDGDMLYPLSGGYSSGGTFSFDNGSGVIKILAIPPGEELAGVVDLARVILRAKVEDGRVAKINVGGRAVTTTVSGATRIPGVEVGIKMSDQGMYTLGDAPAVPPTETPVPLPSEVPPTLEPTMYPTIEPTTTVRITPPRYPTVEPTTTVRITPPRYPTVEPTITVRPTPTSASFGDSCPVCSAERPALTVVTGPNGNYYLGIRWQDVNNNEEGYGVRYCVGSGCAPTTGVTNTGPNITSYLDLGPNRAGYTQGSLVRIRVRGMKTGCSILNCPIADIVIDGSKAISSTSWTNGGGAKPTVIRPTATPAMSIVVVPTSVPAVSTGASCNSRCGNGIRCQEGLVCFPIGLGNCGPISPTVQSKLGQSPLTQNDVDTLKSICPDATDVAIGAVSNPETMIGYCRKPACLSSISCSCQAGVTPVIPTSRGRVYFNGSRVVFGSTGKVWTNGILAKGPGGMLESIEFQVTFDPRRIKVNRFNLIQKGLSKIVTNQVDNVRGTIKVAMNTSMGNTSDVVGLADIEWEAVAPGTSWIKITPIKMEVIDGGVRKVATGGSVSNIFVIMTGTPSVVPARE